MKIPLYIAIYIGHLVNVAQNYYVLYTHIHSVMHINVNKPYIKGFYQLPLKDRVCISLLVRVARIELASCPWQGHVLPLNHTRAVFFKM